MPGAADAIAALDALRARIHAETAEIVQQGALEVQRRAKVNASHRPGPEIVTGRLVGSIKTTPVVEIAPGVFTSSTFPTAIYSRIQELGGTVRPVHAAALYLQRNGEIFATAQEVTLPPRPYLRPAGEEVAAELPATLEERLSAVIETL